MPPAKDWNKIVRELSSGEDSDEHDSLNVLSVQRNAHRVVEMVGGMLGEHRDALPPMGTNSNAVIREGLARASSVASRPTPARAAAALDAAVPPPVPPSIPPA